MTPIINKPTRLQLPALFAGVIFATTLLGGCDTSQFTILPLVFACPDQSANVFEGLEFETDPNDPCVSRFIGDPSELPTYEEWAVRAECGVANAPSNVFRLYRFARCENANALRITQSSGLAGSVAYFDIETRRMISFNFSGDIVIDDPPCNGVNFRIGRVECDDTVIERELLRN